LSLGTLTYFSEDVGSQLLTPTEMRLIEYLMRRAGQTVSRADLIQHVWSIDVGDDTNRIDVYVRRLRHKIERDPVAPRYLRTVRGAGYVFQDPALSGGTGESSVTPPVYRLDPQDLAGDGEPRKPPTGV
jgi:DNA-binding winged helix-turn-helix (wHTH) protein